MHPDSLPLAPARLTGAAALLALLLALVAWLALRADAPPAPGAPPETRYGFVAARALAHVNVLAQAPRPVASSANAAARDYILAQIRALGLAPDVQSATVQAVTVGAMRRAHVTLAVVHNILVRIPGRAASTGERTAVLASAHYDSGSMTLGAADGAMSAGAMLEALRVLRAGPAPAHDLLFLFTDADSGDALGTRAFIEGHPWARRVRLLLRFDNPGNRGPLALIDASHADGAALSAYARLAPAPAGTSFMAEMLASRRPRAADALLAASGAALLQLATTGGVLGPGAVHDIPQRVSTASLQHEGDTMLALLRGTGDIALPAPGARGQVFFGVPGLGVVHYGVALVWPLTLLACVLTALACRAGMRRGVTGIDIVHAAFGCVFMGAAATFVTYLCHDAVPGLDWRWNAGMLAGGEGIVWQVLGFALLLAGCFIVLLRRLQDQRGSLGVLLGVCCLATIALVAVSWGAPGASYVLAWPLLATQAALLVLLSARAAAWPSARKLAVSALAAVPALLLMLPALRDSLLFVSPSWLVLPAALLCTLIGLCGLLLAHAGARIVVAGLLLGGAASIAMASTILPPVPEMPATNQLVYYKDTPSWQSFWLYPPVPLDAWMRSVFPNTMHPYRLPYLFGPSGPPVWYAAAARDDAIDYPSIIVDKLSWTRRTKHLEFSLRSKNRAPHITVELGGSGALRTSVNGRVLTDEHYLGWSLDLYGMEDRDLHVVLDLPGDPAITVFVKETLPGVPEHALPPRPAGLRPALLPLTGTTVSADVLRVD